MVENLGVFAVTSLLLVCTPGPDLLYVLGRGIGQGREVALRSVAGVCAGYVVHTALAAAGVSALLASSPPAFGALRIAGAAYLIWLGARTLASRSPALAGGVRGGAVVRQGVATSLLNPKGLLLFLALLPQFVDPDGGAVWAAVVVLGLVHVVLCALVYGAIAVASGAVGDRLGRDPRLAAALRWVTGGVLLALGARLALDAPGR